MTVVAPELVVMHPLPQAVNDERWSDQPVPNIDTILAQLREKDELVATPTTRKLGDIVLRHDIQSTDAPFHEATEYLVEYPPVVLSALAELYAEYNDAFASLIEANREWPTDYQYATSNGAGLNRWVQIDMVGLDPKFLASTASMSVAEVREVLRRRIFEIENSIAHYGFLSEIHGSPDQPTPWGQQFKSSLNELREQTGKKVALLAVTEEKYESMQRVEFGHSKEEPATDAEVRARSGFDKFFGPEEYQAYVSDCEARGIEPEYLLFVRSSPGRAALARGQYNESSILDDDHLRQIIKKYAITLNIDNPAWPLGDPRRINDTKRWMEALGMGVVFTQQSDLYEVGKTRSHEAPPVTFTPKLAEFLRQAGVAQEQIEQNTAVIRTKPVQGTGAYGNQTTNPRRRDDRQDLKSLMKRFGPYVVQPHMETPVVTDETTGRSYQEIHRVFFRATPQPDGTVKYEFMAGFASLMPMDSEEARAGRNHGNSETVWGRVRRAAAPSGSLALAQTNASSI